MINKTQMNPTERAGYEKAERLFELMATTGHGEDRTDEARAILAAEVDPYLYILVVYNADPSGFDQGWENELWEALAANGFQLPGAPAPAAAGDDLAQQLAEYGKALKSAEAAELAPLPIADTIDPKYILLGC